MIIDTLVIVVCLVTDTPRIPRVDSVPCGQFTEQFQQADSLFNAVSSEAMKSALWKTRFERYRAQGFISGEEYRFLKQGERELQKMKDLNRKTEKP